MFTAALINNSHDMETIQVYVNRQTDKEDGVFVYYGILLSPKRMKFCMDGPLEYYD